LSRSSKGTALGLALCLAVVLAWFSPWWAGGKHLAPLDLLNEMMSPWREPGDSGQAKNHIVSDAVDQYLVYRMVAAENYAREGTLAWSSLTYGGTEQYANTMALYFDWTMQLHRRLDFWTAWHLGLMAQVLLAAWGMFLFLRGRGADVIWSVCGAVAYAANSQFITWIYHRWALGAFCWVPWILWAIDAHRRGVRGAGAGVPLLIGLAFLGGTLQHAALVVLVVMAAWAEEAIKSGRAWKPQARLLGRYGAWGLLGTGLAGMMFLPCIDAFIVSNRFGLHTGMHGNAQNGVYPEGWLQPLFNLAAYPLQVFPWILGRCDSVDLLKLFKSELFYIAYFGTLPVLVAFLAIFRKKNVPVLARLLIVGGLVLPLTPLVRVLYQRLFLLFIFGGILAFVHFMQHAERETRLKVFRWSARVACLLAGAWAVLSVVLAVTREKWDGVLRAKILAAGSGSSFGYFRGWMEARVDRLFDDLMIWSPQQAVPLLLVALALAGLRFTASVTPQRLRMGQLMVAAVVLMEVTLFGARWIVWTDGARHPLFPETAETRILRQEVGSQGRVTTMIHPTAHMARTPFIPNTLSAYGIATIHGYDSILPDGMFFTADRTKDPEVLGRLGVTHLITWPENLDVPPGWQPLWQSPMMALYRNPTVVPRYAAFTDRAAMDRLVEHGDRSGVSPVTETLGLENRRHLEVPPGATVVRIAENHSAGWEFKTAPEGAWQPALRASDATMILPLGESLSARAVEMRYRPPLATRGLAISGVALFLVLAQWLFAWSPMGRRLRERSGVPLSPLPGS